MDNDGHFTSAKRAKASGLSVCQSCMKNWKIKYPPKPKGDALVPGEPQKAEGKTLVANPDPSRFTSPSFKFGDDELDIITISKLRVIAYTIAHVKYDYSQPEVRTT